MNQSTRTVHETCICSDDSESENEEETEDIEKEKPVKVKHHLINTVPPIKTNADDVDGLRKGKVFMQLYF